MTYRVAVELTIGPYRFDFVQRAQVSCLRSQLGDTAVFELPRARYMRDGKPARVARPEVGMPVVLRAGYAQATRALPLEFVGTVARVEPGPPLRVFCEDAAYGLKRTSVNKTFTPPAAFADVLATLLPQGMEVANQVESDWRCDYLQRVTAFEGLKWTLNQLSAVGYFEPVDSPDGAKTRFVAGLFGEDAVNGSPVRLDLYGPQCNVESHRLESRRAEDVPLRVIVKVGGKSPLEVAVGDTAGEVRTLHFRDIAEAEARRRGEEFIARERYTGYRGSLTLLGLPVARRGGSVDLRHPDYPELGGNYLVEGTQFSVSENGVRREVTIGQKLG